MSRVRALGRTVRYLALFALYMAIGVPMITWMAAHELVRDAWGTTWVFVRRAWRGR